MMRRIGASALFAGLLMGLLLSGCQSKPAEKEYLAPAARSNQPPPGRPEALGPGAGAVGGQPAMPPGRPGALGGG